MTYIDLRAEGDGHGKFARFHGLPDWHKTGKKTGSDWNGFGWAGKRNMVVLNWETEPDWDLGWAGQARLGMPV